MALCAITRCFAESSWANVMPPSALTAFMPMAPSEPLPEKMTATARLRLLSASEWKKQSMGMW